MTLPGRTLEDVLARRRLPALDGLRAVAVFTVIGFHDGFQTSPAGLGVAAFFVLSGFLITWLLLQEQHDLGFVSIRSFYARRALRIFPAYYAYLGIVFLEETVRGFYWTTEQIGSSVFYYVNYYNAFNGHPGGAIAHLWSLAIEEQFYLIWPAVFLLLIKKGVKPFALTVGGIIALVLVWRSSLLYGGKANVHYLYNAFDTRFDNIAVGCLLALCLEMEWFRQIARWFGKFSLSPLLTLLILGLSAMGGSSRYHYSIGFTIDAVLLGVLIAQMMQLYESRLWSWLESPVVRYLGLVSYPLYLWHGLGISIGHRLVANEGPLRIVTVIAVCVTLASASYWIVERPFLSLKNRFKARAITLSPVGHPIAQVEH